MLKLEELKKGMHVTGLVPGRVATIVSADFVGANALNLFYTTDQGPCARQLYRCHESELALAVANIPWTFSSPSEPFKLVLEALRIKLGAQFDPMTAIHASNVIPLPHQISAVYENMLPKTPLRYVLADDPGAGKTIMAGLLIKELILRGEAERVLIVSPGSLTEQWQSELKEKFDLDFRIFSREAQEQSVSGNFFEDEDFVVARVDQLSRAEDIQGCLLQARDWDLVIFDEAHKLSAHYAGKNTHKTQRYELAEKLGRHCRDLLMMTATPHNGKDEDFQLWLQLLDPDRFFGVTGADGKKIKVDESVMRRMVKEDLLKFDGTRLFPKRVAETLQYNLTGPEQNLYKAVTDYVVDGMNKADRLANPKAKNCVGFALTMLQRRLASSPEAIYQSLRRRHERLLQKLKEEKSRTLSDFASGHAAKFRIGLPNEVVSRAIEDFDEDDLTAEEAEALANDAVTGETAALSIPELEHEVETLAQLAQQAGEILESHEDCKWNRLRELLQAPDMMEKGGNRRKLIIFTEHRDTLNYLVSRIGEVTLRPDAVVTIHGSTNREARREVQEQFRNNPAVEVLVATDAAGEGVNLQNANLMVNYDLPWNPNRLEQRFGRIHRIGQTLTCYLWNLVAVNTREGQVFDRLLAKLNEEAQTLQGRVFDILGAAFEEVSLKEMLLRAIKDGESAESKNWMKEKIASALDSDHLRDIIRRNSLVEQTMTTDMVYRIKDEMDRAEARKLQPFFVRAFLQGALKELGGDLRRRNKGRFEIPHVPAELVHKARLLNPRRPLATRYEAVCFDKETIRVDGLRPAEFLHAAHPLLRAAIAVLEDRHGGLLKPGTVLVDTSDEGTQPSLLALVDHSVTAGRPTHVLSRRLQFVRLRPDGSTDSAGWAPHLDLAPATPDALELASEIRHESWLAADLEAKVLAWATDHVVAEHYAEVRARQCAAQTKLLAGIQDQLTKAINFYAQKYAEYQRLAAQPEAPATAHALMEQMRQKGEELASRLAARQRQAADETNVISCAPVVGAGILVIPQGLLDRRAGQPATPTTFAVDSAARQHVERLAMQAVMEAERRLGNTVIDVSAEKCGWDVTSRPPAPSNPDEPQREDRHIEVKGRVKGATDVILTCNEVRYAANQRDKFILALVFVDGEKTDGPYYIKDVAKQELDFGQSKVVCIVSDLMTKAKRPEEV